MKVDEVKDKFVFYRIWKQNYYGREDGTYQALSYGELMIAYRELQQEERACAWACNFLQGDMATYYAEQDSNRLLNELGLIQEDIRSIILEGEDPTLNLLRKWIKQRAEKRQDGISSIFKNTVTREAKNLQKDIIMK